MSPHPPPVGQVITVAILAAVGLALGGLLGAGAAMAALAVLWSGHARREHLLVAAVCLLAFAAVMTTIEAPIEPEQIGANYAAARPVAARAGMLAGLLVIVTVADLASERRSLSLPQGVARSANEGVDATNRRRPQTGLIVAVAGGAAAAVVAATGGPPALSPLAEELAANINTGVGYGRFDEATFHPSGLHAPLGPLAAALGPGSPGVQLALAVGVGAALAVTLAVRLGGVSAGIGTALVAACSPLLWSQELPVALASASLTAALVLTIGHTPSTKRMVAAGFCVGAASLAVPWAIIALVVLLPRRSLRFALVLTAVVALVVVPWSLWVHNQFDTRTPTTDAVRYLADASAPDATGGGGIGGRVPSPLPLPGAEPPEATIRWAHHLQPQVMAARALRVWDVWPPHATMDDRSALGLTNPGGAGAIGVSWFVLAAALWGVRHHRSAALRPLLVLPVAMTIAAALSAGERNLASLSGGAISVIAGVAVAGAWSARSRSRPPEALVP